MKLSSVLLPLILGSAAATSRHNKGPRALEDSNAEEVKYYTAEAEDESEEVKYYTAEAEEESEEVKYYAEAEEEAEEESEEVKYYAEAEEEAEEESEEVNYYAEAEEEAEEEEEEWVDETGAFGSDDYYLSDDFFDMSKYSLKVHSCASIKGINPDELTGDGSGDGDEDWANKTTAVINYRLCPTDTCQDSSWQGCRNVYGNYMVSVKEFLENKMEDKDEKQDELCEKCDWCSWAKETLYYECDIYEECQSANCDEESKDEEGEEKEKEEEIEYHEFAECTAVDIYVEEEAEEAGNSTYYGNRRKLDEDANQVYLQIYCDGGTTLKIGVYSDEDCMNYIGDQYDISEITGLNVTESDLENELVSDCVSCKQSDSKYYFPEWDENGEQKEEEGDENESRDEEQIAEVCERIYEDSIKCNEYIPFNETAYYDEAEEWAETTNNVTCAFLEAMQKDSGGVVTITSSHKNNKNNGNDNNYNSYSESTASISGGKVFAVGVTLAAIGAAVAAKNKNSKTIGQDLDAAFVDNGNEIA